MPRISVDIGWDPFGESWVSIAHKLIVLNQTHRSSYNKWCFGRHKSRHAHSVTKALDAKDFDLHSISRLTGWKPIKLRASFFDFLLGFDQSLSNTKAVESVVNVSLRLRVCPSCFIEGIHLTFHQCMEFGWCPLHFEPLTDLCPQCKMPLRRYEVSSQCVKEMRSESYFDCKRCKTGGLGRRTGHKEELLQRKIRVVTQYQQWCFSIVNGSPESLQPQDIDLRKLVWRSDCAKFMDIQKLIQIYKCPNWLRKSLFGPSCRIAKVVDRCGSPCYGRIAIKGFRSSKKSSFALKQYETRKQFNDLLYQRMHIFQQRLARTAISSKLNKDRPMMFRGQEMVTWRFSDNRSAAATALVMLQWAVEDLTDLDRRAATNDFWEYWWRGPAQFVLFSQRSRGWTMYNKAITVHLSSIWFDRMLISLFKTLLFHSAAQGEPGKLPVIHTPSLVNIMNMSGCTPMFLLMAEGRSLNFYEISVFKSLDFSTRLFSGQLDQLSINTLHTADTKKRINTLKKTPFNRMQMYSNCVGYNKYYGSIFHNLKLD